MQTEVDPAPIRLKVKPIEDLFKREYGLPPEVRVQYNNVKQAAQESRAAVKAAAESAVVDGIDECVEEASAAAVTRSAPPGSLMSMICMLATLWVAIAMTWR